MIRTGFGYDVHQLKAGEQLILGGVLIPFSKGSVGHSDGDVLCHAVVDALLGAANLGDIGDHFPSEDSRWKGASSLTFVQMAGEKIQAEGFDILHVDCTVILQEVRVKPHIPEMKSLVRDKLQIGEDRISIKATTTDFLGFTGRGEGVAAMALATLSAVK
ncbi:MAG: 2-C-methyl-D-erythritol 2,4-cyclodiphosphate synthase [Candidatus Neomarinimicrobiota bacterium]